MNRSFFTSNVDFVLASGSANFSAKISASPLEFGLSAQMASDYAALDAAFQNVYRTSLAPDTRTKLTVSLKNDARTPLRKMAAELGKIVMANPTVSDAQRIDLGIAVRATRSPRPAPGTPFDFRVTLSAIGELTLTWKCKNPKGTSGTMYQVWRRIGPTGPFVYLGQTGEKMFRDETIPLGSAMINYRVQAVRSTKAGAAAEHIVNFGGIAMSRSVANTPGLMKAA